MRYGGAMPAAAITLEVLPAGYGDALLVTCPLRRGAWRMLVDTGPDECWPMLRKRLAEIPQNAKGQRRIDLMIVSHIDHDHIGGAKALFADKTLNLVFGDVWFNAPEMPGMPKPRGVAEGHALAAVLGVSASTVPWNKAWVGMPAVTSAEAAFIEVTVAKGSPKITVLSPSPDSLSRLLKVWDRQVARLGLAAVAAPHAGSARTALDLEALASRKTAVDKAPANGSSIALLLEHKGRSLLLGADAHPQVLVPALAALSQHRGQPMPLQVDAFKLSHHGSRANVTVGLLQAVQAEHYLVSTNGAIFGHPDDEAIARVILKGGRARSIWFNYSTERVAKWMAHGLQERYGYTARAVIPSEVGVKLELS